MYKLNLAKTEEPEIKLPTSIGSQKKLEKSTNVPTSASLTVLKHFTVWITTNCGKFLKILEYLRNLYAGQEATVRTGHGKKRTVSNLGKECIKAIYCHPAF